MRIALLSRKGGVGKTTTAVSLSAALAARGRRVLLLDLDAQAAASLSLGVGKGELAPSSADVLLRGLPLAEAVRPTAVAGLDLVTAGPDLASAEVDLAELRARETRLRRALEAAALGGAYDFLIMDCPATLGLLSVNALLAADAYLVPMTPQYLVLQGLSNFLDAIERLCRRFGHRARLLGLLLTMADYRNRATRLYVDQLREQFGERVLGIEIRVNVRLAEAPSFGQTIFDYDPSATGARAYTLLAEEVLLRCEAAAAAP